MSIDLRTKKGQFLEEKGKKRIENETTTFATPCTSAPLFCVLCIDSGDEGVNGEEQDSEAAGDKNCKCAPKCAPLTTLQHKNCNKTIVTNQLYCAVSALHAGN